MPRDMHLARRIQGALGAYHVEVAAYKKKPGVPGNASASSFQCGSEFQAIPTKFSAMTRLRPAYTRCTPTRTCRTRSFSGCVAVTSSTKDSVRPEVADEEGKEQRDLV